MAANKSLRLTNWLIDNHYLPEEEPEAARKAAAGLAGKDLKKLRKKLIGVLPAVKKNKTQKTLKRLGIVKGWHKYLREHHGAKFDDKDRDFDLVDDATYSET